MTKETLRSILHDQQLNHPSQLNLEGLLQDVRRRRRRRRLGVTIAAAACLALIAGVAGAALNNRDSQSSEGPTAQDESISESESPDPSGLSSEASEPATTEPSLSEEPSVDSDPEASRLRVAGDLTPEQVAVAKAFIAFALDPEPRTAMAVPFVDRGLRTGFAGKEPVQISPEEVAHPDAWEAATDFGTSNALLQITRASLNAKGNGPIFTATDRRPGLCVGPTGAETLDDGTTLSLVSADSADCAAGFRVDLVIDADGRLAAVWFEVQEP